jgi:hypothetical protein
MSKKSIDLCGLWNMTYMQHVDFLKKHYEPKSVSEVKALAGGDGSGRVQR